MDELKRRYQLKAGQPDFRLRNGSHKGQVFKHGMVYDSVPREQEHMFDKVEVSFPPESASPAATADAGGTAAAEERPARGMRRRARPAAAPAEGGE